MELDSKEIDRRARVIYMAMEPSVSYADAVKFVTADLEDPDGRLQFAGADPESLKLHEEIRNLIQDEKAKGHVLTYLEAARLVEERKQKKR